VGKGRGSTLSMGDEDGIECHGGAARHHEAPHAVLVARHGSCEGRPEEGPGGRRALREGRWADDASRRKGFPSDFIKKYFD